MFKTIFRKQFLPSIAIFAVSLLALSIALISFYSRQIVDNKASMLEEQAKRLSEIYRDAYVRNLDAFFLDASTVSRINYEMQVLVEYLDASCFFTDTDFRINGASNDLFEYLNDKLVDSEIVEDVSEGKVLVKRGRLGGLLPEDSLTVCYPVVVGGNVRAVVVVSSSMGEISGNIYEVYRITLICIVTTAISAFILIFIVSRQISKPVRQISEVATFIASGNFDRRIEYKSQDEIGRMAKSFNDMADSLNNQEKRRREFLANVSHDLRSPLTSMKGFVQAIIDGTIPHEKQEHYLKIVLEESDRLSKLANDILDLNKIESLDVDLDLSIFDINELIAKTLAMFERKITHESIEVGVIYAEEKNFVCADYEKIMRVLFNLIDNAVKFSGGCGKIDVETKTSGTKLYTTVKDSGPGIDEEDQKRVFERFYKADESRGQDKTGSGLGLAIVKEFIRAHDENVTLISEAGKGCEFTFSLPLAKSESY